MPLPLAVFSQGLFVGSHAVRASGKTDAQVRHFDGTSLMMPRCLWLFDTPCHDHGFDLVESQAYLGHLCTTGVQDLLQLLWGVRK